jgi:hypothetical protein
VANGRFGSKIACANSKEGDGVATPIPYTYEDGTYAYEDGTECSETSAYKIKTPGNYPKENIQLNLTCLRLLLDEIKSKLMCARSCPPVVCLITATPKDISIKV